MSNIIPHYDSITYGAVSSTVLTLSIVYGLYAVGAKKSSFVISCLALLISDPLSHVMAENIANNHNQPIGIIGFLIHLFSQLIIVLIFVYSKNIEWGIRITTLFSLLTTGFWIMYQHNNISYTLASLGSIMLIIYFIFQVETALGTYK
tara:strand:+ start:703 stop:1146 length:444 start_codon:yes stop_codon:yes gene_type:complete